jgi:hypothetical protein
MARSRCPWLLLPWIEVAANPARSRCFINRSAPCLVREKTSARSSRCPSRRSISRSCFWSFGTKCTEWVTLSATLPGGDTSIRTGLSRYWRDSSAIAFGIVAENIMVCRSVAQHRRDAAQRMDEADVEHLVGLVENKEPCLAQVDGPAIHQVDQPARRRHEDVGAAGEPLGLRVDRLAADDKGDAQIGRQPLKALDDLIGEFPGRRKHQAAGRFRRGFFGPLSTAPRPAECQRRRSCRFRSGRSRECRGLAAPAGSPAAESVSAWSAPRHRAARPGGH